MWSRIYERCQSNPCVNGGTCLPPTPSNRKCFRYRCNCSHGYGGERCEVKQCIPVYTGENCDLLIGRSCRGCRNGGRISGQYIVLDVDMNPFNVFYNFDRDSFRTWTLVQSYRQDSAKLYITVYIPTVSWYSCKPKRALVVSILICRKKKTNL